MRGEKGRCPSVRQFCAFGVSAIAHFGCEAMIKALIIMQRHLGVITKAGVNRGLRLWPDKMVRGWNM